MTEPEFPNVDPPPFPAHGPKDAFLYPYSLSSKKLPFSHLIFEANLQEFAQRVSIICALQANGKLPPSEAFDQIRSLWQTLEVSRQNLLNASVSVPPDPPFSDVASHPLDPLIGRATVFISVIVPTYNRLPILKQCLQAMEHQQPGEYQSYEVIVVDDGSTDGTVDWLRQHQSELAHVRLFEQNHRGPSAARNLGCRQAKGNIIIFIDSDLVVVDDFLKAHAQTLKLHGVQGDPQHDRKVFTYGRVINTANFEDPFSEPFKPTDFSAAFFATGNVAISRHWLTQAQDSPSGPFDERFTLYGWEDLELGVRLKKLGLRLVKCPTAAGYHWHPPFQLDQIPRLIDREWQRGRMGILFYEKHPTWEVRLMIQMTPLHWILWGLLSLWGWLNERRVAPLLEWLIQRGRSQLALELCRVFFLNWYNVQGVYAAYRESKQGLVKS